MRTGPGDGDAVGFDADPQFPPVDGMPVTCDKIAVLFVIDNSGSMEQEQQNLISSICQGELSIGLGQALDLFDAACGQIIF